MLAGAAAPLTGPGRLLADPWVLWSSCWRGLSTAELAPSCRADGAFTAASDSGRKVQTGTEALKPNLLLCCFVFF